MGRGEKDGLAFLEGGGWSRMKEERLFCENHAKVNDQQLFTASKR